MVNIKKNKIVIFNKNFGRTTKNLHFEIDNKKIEIANSYRYLGVDISNTGSFLNATDSLYKKGLRALYSIYSTLDVRSDVANVRLFIIAIYIMAINSGFFPARGPEGLFF